MPGSAARPRGSILRKTRTQPHDVKRYARIRVAHKRLVGSVRAALCRVKSNRRIKARRAVGHAVF